MRLAEEEIRQLQQEAGMDFRLTLGERNIAKATAQLALSEDADLIVMGGGKAQARFGAFRTHAYGIIRQAPCPVLSCRTGRSELRPHAAETENAQNQLSSREPAYFTVRTDFL